MKVNKNIRKARTRSNIQNNDKMRVTVFRSNMNIYAQVIDPKTKKVILSVSSATVEGKKSKVEKAHEVGLILAKVALEGKIENIVFDRGAYKYHGRVKALAEGAREGGLKF